MDHYGDVSRWQQDIQHEGVEAEVGSACSLFEAAIAALSPFLSILAADLANDSGAYESLRREFQKFYMWNEGYSTRTGDLDEILACSKDLKSTVLGLMAQWTKTVSKGVLLLGYI